MRILLSPYSCTATDALVSVLPDLDRACDARSIVSAGDASARVAIINRDGERIVDYDGMSASFVVPADGRYHVLVECRRLHAGLRAALSPDALA